MGDGQDGDQVDVLLVEDNPGDVRLVDEAFEQGAIDSTLHVVRDGEEALDYLFERGEYDGAPRPDIVLLDLNLPKRNGMAVLEAVKSDPAMRRIPIVILTSSEATEDVIRGYEHHAAAYLTKPVDPEAFIELVGSIEAFWFDQARLPPAPEDP